MESVEGARMGSVGLEVALGVKMGPVSFMV